MVVITKKAFPPFGLVKYQCLAAVCVNLIVFCHGTTVGWCAPSFWLMLSDESPLASGKASLDDTSWIGSVVYVGSIIGSCLFSVMLKYFRGKTVMAVLAIPYLLAWIIVLCANYPFQLIIARVLTGLTSGGAYLCVPLFVADIANKNIRGILGSIFGCTVSLGLLFGLIVSMYLPYGVNPYIFMVPALIYTGSIITFPQTPQSLLMSHKTQEAEKSFRFYNFGNEQEGKMTPDVKLEFEQLCATITKRMKDSQSNEVTFRTFLGGSTLKGISTGIFLCALAMFSGIFPINIYSISIFAETGTTFDPKISAISCAIIQIGGCCVASIFIDRWGRKILLSASCLGSIISIVCFATFAFLHQRNYEMTSFYWVPITSMALFIFSNNVGLLPLPFVIIAESLPQSTRQIGATICSFSFSGFAFTIVKVFPILSSNLGLHVVMWTFGGVCLIGLIFGIFVLKETKGKSIDN